NHGGFNNTWGDELIGRFALNFKPIKNLTITGVIAPSIRSVKGKEFIRQIPYYEYDNTTSPSGYINGNLTTSLAESRSEVRTTTKQLTANYDTDFGTDHGLSIMAGYEDYYRFSEGLNASSDNLAVAD